MKTFFAASLLTLVLLPVVSCAGGSDAASEPTIPPPVVPQGVASGSRDDPQYREEPAQRPPRLVVPHSGNVRPPRLAANATASVDPGFPPAKKGSFVPKVGYETPASAFRTLHGSDPRSVWEGDTCGLPAEIRIGQVLTCCNGAVCRGRCLDYGEKGKVCECARVAGGCAETHACCGSCENDDCSDFRAPLPRGQH